MTSSSTSHSFKRARPSEPRADRSSPLAQLPKVRCFARSGALVLELAQVRSDLARDLGFGAWTLQLDAAAADPGGATRRYLWDQKITLQLTPQEFMQFAALVLRLAGPLQARHHGERNNKSLSVRDNPDGGLYFDVREAG